MTTTHHVISKQTVGADGASSITFSNIPQTFTDLKIIISSRSTYGGIEDYVKFQFNGTTTNLSAKYLYGNGSSAASATSASRTRWTTGRSPGATPASTRRS